MASVESGVGRRFPKLCFLMAGLFFSQARGENPEWRACLDDTECIVVDDVCGGFWTAIGKRNQDQFRAYKVRITPMTRCATGTIGATRPAKARCKNQNCVVVVESARPSPAYLDCAKDEDCVSVSTHCNGCRCGAAVHRQFEKKWNDYLRKQCEGYVGPICDSWCPPRQQVCRSNTCVLIR